MRRSGEVDILGADHRRDPAGAEPEEGGRGKLVQRAVRTTGHCEFAPAEAATAWNDLVDWVEHRDRPAGDRVDRRSVAAADYGGVLRLFGGSAASTVTVVRLVRWDRHSRPR